MKSPTLFDSFLFSSFLSPSYVVSMWFVWKAANSESEKAVLCFSGSGDVQDKELQPKGAERGVAYLI